MPPEGEHAMAERHTNKVETAKTRVPQSYDFDECSDMCDFGYALESAADATDAAASKPAN
jgi:hypothetical protein